MVCSSATKEWWGSGFGGHCQKAGRAAGTDLCDQSCYFSGELGPKEKVAPGISRLESCTE